MANISVSDLNFSESESFLSSLGTEESSLIKGAIDCALLARRLSDGRRKHCGIKFPEPFKDIPKIDENGFPLNQFY